MKRFSLLCLLSASLALAACNFNTTIDATITPGSESSTSSNSSTSNSSTNSDETMSSDSTTDTTISPENIEDNFSVKIKTAEGGSWIHLIAEWKDSAFAVKDSDLITLDDYKPVIDNTISFTNLLPDKASSSSNSRTWGVGFKDAKFITEIKHSLVLHMNVNGGLYKITVPFIGKLNMNDEEFDITEEGISFERVGNKLDVPGDNSGNSGNNNPGNSGDDGTYENGHGAGAVSEVRPSPSISGITTSTNDVALRKNLNSWSSVVFQFTNSTGNVWSDDEIYLYALCQVAATTPSAANPDNVAVGGYCYVTPDGKLHAIGTTSSSKWEIKFSDIKESGIEMPLMQSGRIFYSYGQPLTMKGNGTMQGYASPSLANPSDPNYNKYYDWLEFSVATNGFWVNTTQVDQLGFPVLINVFGKTKDTQDTVQTTGLSKTRAEIWDSFKNYCPDEFDTLAGTYRIVAPGKKGFDERTGDKYGNYFNDYVDYVWDYYKTHSGSVTHPKGVFTISGDGTNLYFECTESRDDNQMGKKGETYTVRGKPTTSMVLEGYEVLASGNEMELALEAWICAAFNRGVAHLPPDTYWNNPEFYYRGDLYSSNSWWRCNWYAGAWHEISESGGLAYGFCYDDVNDQSATTYVYTPENVVVKLGF